MSVIFTEGATRAIRGAAAGLPAYTPPANDVLWQRGAYAHLYRSQPSVRTAIDLLARNVAQLGLHLYGRTVNDDRVRDRAAGPARLLDRPHGQGGHASSFDLLLETVLHFAIYGEAYWWKQGPAGARDRIWVVHPRALTARSIGLGVGAYDWALPSGERVTAAASNFVRFWWPDPEDPLRACPWLETLRAIVAEDQAASRHRMTVWRTGARWAGVVERPKGLNWTDAQRDRWRSQMEQQFSGDAGAGRIVLLEDDMKFKETSWSLAETQAYETRKQNANEITRTYQIPLPMAGILDHATFSNIREQHKNLYQDCLGPLLSQLEEALRIQLLDEYGLFDSHYFEFNVNEKLKGAFEEQVTSLARAIDGPWMTPNEGRKRVNLPAVAGGDALYPQRGSGQPAAAGLGGEETREPEEAVH